MTDSAHQRANSRDRHCSDSGRQRRQNSAASSPHDATMSANVTSRVSFHDSCRYASALASHALLHGFAARILPNVSLISVMVIFAPQARLRVDDNRYHHQRDYYAPNGFQCVHMFRQPASSVRGGYLPQTPLGVSAVLFSQFVGHERAQGVVFLRTFVKSRAVFLEIVNLFIGSILQSARFCRAARSRRRLRPRDR